MSCQIFGYSYDNGLVMARADIETSFTGKRGAKVKKNWENAAHFHWVLKSARFSEAEPEDGGKVVGCEEDCAARVAVERRGIRQVWECRRAEELCQKLRSVYYVRINGILHV